MNTTYETVYRWFLKKVTYYSLAMFSDTEKEDLLYEYMIIACAKFKCCTIDLSNRNDDLKEFNNYLDDEILDIISETMIVVWLQPKLNNEENLVNSLSTKDYNIYSPANLISKITELFKLAKKNSKTMISNYSFEHGILPTRNVLP